MMGAEESKGGPPCYGLMGPSTVVSNMNRQAQMARAWALLHQCSLDQWKCGHGGLYLFKKYFIFSIQYVFHVQ